MHCNAFANIIFHNKESRNKSVLFLKQSCKRLFRISKKFNGYHYSKTEIKNSKTSFCSTSTQICKVITLSVHNANHKVLNFLAFNNYFENIFKTHFKTVCVVYIFIIRFCQFIRKFSACRVRDG